jgi:ketosteroid isomerase-like protein
MTISQTRVLERYFEALRSHDWASLAECLADDVHRTGPYLDVVKGKRAYVEFLSRVVPTLPNYALSVTRIRKLGEVSAVVELTESLDVDGVSREFPEALFFDFDEEGRILRVDIYVKRPPIAEAPQA